MEHEANNMWTRPFARSWVVGTVLVWLLRMPAFADHGVTLAWIPSADPEAAGYNIYYGGDSGDYTNTVNLGNVTNATISGLSGGAAYYFSATTVDASGEESGFSTEVTCVIPDTDPNAPVSTPPTLNAITNLTLYENSGLQTVALAGIGAGSGGNPAVTVSAVSSDPTIISTPTVNYTNSSGTGSLTFTPVPNALGTASVTVTVNNGAASNNLASQVFTVTVVPTPVVSQPPTLNAITNLTLYENAGLQTVALAGIGAGSGGNLTVTVSAVSSVPSIIPTPTVNYTKSSSTGSLTFTPVPNALGTASVTVTVNNGAASNNLASQVFTVTVVPTPVVSQPPTLNAITNLTLYENAGLQTVALAGIGAGSGGNLTVTVSAVSSEPTIIPTPTVNYTNSSGTGSLTFTPVPNALGTASVTVTVNNGAASNNLASQIFTVTVVPTPVVSQPPTLNAITNLTLYENAGLQTVALAGIGAGSGGNPTVTVSAVSSEPTIIPTPTVNYTKSSSTGSLTFTPVPNALGTASVTVTVNNGAASNNLASQVFTVTVVSVVVPLGGNHPPTLNAITNVSLVQGTLSGNITLSGITSGSPTQKQMLKVSAVSSNPGLIPTPAIRYVSPASTAVLTLLPARTGVGTAMITVTVNNGGKSNNLVCQRFAVTVVANRPPTLNPIPNVTLTENAGNQTITLTGISSGSPIENQALEVSATSSNPRLIPTPTIRYTSPTNFATLTFKPAINATGTAIVTVTVNDGSQNNNLVHQCFTVSVMPPAANGRLASAASPTEAATLTTVAGTKGRFSFQVTGMPGRKYVVHATSDLTHWTPLQTNTAPFTFLDQTTDGARQRFYRAIYLPDN